MWQELPTDVTTTTAMASPSKREKRATIRATWYNFQKVKLIKTLSELNTAKYWARNGWNEEAWRIVQRCMKDCGGCFDYSIKQMKNQERALKKQYDTVKKLVRLNGFHWDKSHGKVLAHGDLWKQLFEVYWYPMHASQSDKCAEKWCRMQFPLYEELCKLYEGTSPKQDCSKCANLTSKQSSVCSYAPPPKLRSVIKQFDQSSGSSEESSNTDENTNRKAEILEMILLDEVTSKIRWPMSAGTIADKPQKDCLEKKYSITYCMKALNGSSGFTLEERFKAANVFGDAFKSSCIFFAMWLCFVSLYHT